MITAKRFVKFINNEDAQGMVEYGLIMALIVIALVVSLGLMKDSLVAFFGKVKDILNGTVASAT